MYHKQIDVIINDGVFLLQLFCQNTIVPNVYK
jgi:hypothetical protein